MFLKYFLLLLCSLLGAGLRCTAQLNGIYTIGNSGADYSTINLAITDLVNLGISNNVIFKIQNGLYNESLIINHINGVSENKTITFCSENGDSTSVVITNNSGNILSLDSVSYITFKQITFKSYTPDLNIRLIEIKNNSCNNNILNSQIIANDTSGVLIFSPNSTDTSNKFRNNLFVGAKAAIVFLGLDSLNLEKGTEILNNQFYSSFGDTVIFLTNQTNFKIKGNFIYFNKSNKASSRIQSIFLQYCMGKGIITSNKIIVDYRNSIYESYLNGIFMFGCRGNLVSRICISNNVIDVKGVGKISNLYGVNMSSFTKNIDFWHNSIKVSGLSLYSGSSPLRTANQTTGLNIKNNILVNLSNDGEAFSLHPSNYNNSSNYNNLYVGSNNTQLAYTSPPQINHLNITSLQQAGFDSSSISIFPNFIDSLLKIDSSSALCGAGKFLTAVVEDINGKTRNNPPTIGAYELESPCVPDMVKRIDSYLKEILMIYPNPNSGSFVVNVQDDKMVDQIKVIITNVTGQIIENEIVKLKNNSFVFDKNLSNGVYFITINKDDYYSTKRIVVIN